MTNPYNIILMGFLRFSFLILKYDLMKNVIPIAMYDTMVIVLIRLMITGKYVFCLMKLIERRTGTRRSSAYTHARKVFLDLKLSFIGYVIVKCTNSA